LFFSGEMGGDVDCVRVRALLPLVVADRIKGNRLQKIREHLSFCLPCRRAYEARRRLHSSVSTSLSGSKAAPGQLKESIRACMDCMDNPGKRVCPRLRFKVRLVTPPPDDLK
jgi:hypothetical protein